ncbi:protein-ER retention protein [Scheffersomyces spartinae]|uniref:Protein-ER retention protein n=1 Tax=Scheffersomyces spartinae TaxID=45513 RepID=A0A9P7VCL9_9ASCO|nr:protein-ER retention protein [Scheffersomyces spartinae]KAG7195335.1 protein-ER retention protein [Scheffersomyces spartinae]
MDTNIAQGTIFHLVPFYALGDILRIMFFIQSPQGQKRSFTTLKRIIKGSINSTTTRTNDILLSDSLTSYSKVLNDIGLFLWSYYLSSEVQYNVYLEFFILSAPTIMRVSQCWQEYKLHRGTVRVHLFNMIKYLVSLLPLMINLFIKVTILRQHDEQTEINRLELLNFWWYVVSFLSSSYSCLWDIFMDWKLAIFKGTQLQIRPTLLLGSKPFYIMAIWIDFVVRFLWIGKLFIDKEINESTRMVTKLTTFLFAYDAFSAGYTIVELTEILRRWMWCFLKLENDYINIQLQDGIELKTVK